LKPVESVPVLLMVNEATAHIATRLGFVLRCLWATAFLFIFAPSVQAIPIKEYSAKLQQAVTALDTLAQVNETEDAAAYEARRDQTIAGVRTLLPSSETVEWNGGSFNVDNSWLGPELDKLKAAKSAERADELKATTERLQAIEERIADIQGTTSGPAGDRAAAGNKLAEILRRPEYARKVKHESALERVLNQFIKWFQNLFPKPKPVSPGTAGVFSQIAQVFVILLALGVLVFVAKLFLPRLLRPGKSRKKEKSQARIVLGEKLEPDQSAVDLLSEAEALARRGELRAAIRKAYIALLVELGDRKIISLAQHKTNRDYLRALRELQPLYQNVKQLTDSFERHWYGLAHATDTDWAAFRSSYEQALRR
jgi:hypothetical protein